MSKPNRIARYVDALDVDSDNAPDWADRSCLCTCPPYGTGGADE